MTEDDTRKFLQEQLGHRNSTHITLLFEDNVTQAALPRGTTMTDNGAHKIARIARARNKVLDFVLYGNSKIADYDYFAMLDMDMLCTMDPRTGDYDHSIFKYVLLSEL